MEPNYTQGEHVLTFNWVEPKKGQAIIYFEGKYFIKRIKSINNNLIEVAGDNIKMSAKMKPIKKDQIIGKVILKY